MKRTWILMMVATAFLASCKPQQEPNNDQQIQETNVGTPASNESEPVTTEKEIREEAEIYSKYGEGIYAQFHITEGDVLIKLEMDKTPLTTANFVALAEGKMQNTAKKLGVPFYDGLTFHRVISIKNGDGQQFMIQGGDPMGSGMGGPGYEFRDEFHPDLKHNAPGILSMANSGKNTNGSQFFITLTPTPHLDNVHSIFGKVVEGFDVANRTLQNDKIRWVAIIRVGEAAKKFDAVETFNKLK